MRAIIIAISVCLLWSFGVPRNITSQNDILITEIARSFFPKASAIGFNQASCTVTVNPGPGTPIQSAINTANDGAVICIGAGKSEERIYIYQKSLTLNGAGRAQTLITGEVKIESPSDINVTIKNLAVDGLGKLYETIEIIGQVKITMTGVRISGSANCSSCAGLDLKDSVKALLTDVQINGNSENGLVLKNSEVAMNNVDISNNSYRGVWAMSPASVQIQDSKIEANALGLLSATDLSSTGEVQMKLTNVQFSKNGRGIEIKFGSANLTNVQVTDNRGDGITIASALNRKQVLNKIQILRNKGNGIVVVGGTGSTEVMNGNVKENVGAGIAVVTYGSGVNPYFETTS